MQNESSTPSGDQLAQCDLNVLALDKPSSEILLKIQGSLMALCPQLYDNVQINLFSFDELPQTNIRDDVFILTSCAAASSNLWALESRLNLKAHCDLILAITIDTENGIIDDKEGMPWPKGYRCVQLHRDSGGECQAPEMLISSLLTSIFVSFYRQNVVCMDPKDFYTFCAYHNRITFYRFDNSSGIANLSDLQQAVLQLSGPIGVFICLDEDWGIMPIRMWITDDILNEFPDIFLELLEFLEWLDLLDGAKRMNVFLGL